MTAPRTMHLGLSLSATWLRGAAWRRPDSRAEDLFSPGLFIELAQRAEAAKLDFVFKPDALQLDSAVLETWPGMASLEPVVMMTAIAMQTRRIGLVPTVSATFSQPYTVARQLQSLAHVSGGRAGLNVVTSLDGHRNYGLDDMPDGVQRYVRAEEFIAVLQSLLASWPIEAQLLDRREGRYADATLVKPTDFEGQHFSVAGPLSIPQRASGRMPIVHAGGSDAAVRLAGRHADAVFTAARTVEEAQAQKRAYAQAALNVGRHEHAVKVMPGLAFTLAPTRAEAEDLQAAMQPTGDVRKPIAVHGGVVGTPDDAFNHVASWFEAGAADGFILLPGGSLTSLYLFLDEVVPRLVEAGLLRGEYRGDTLADHLCLA